ncbi:MAG: thiol:disulfide interchange protein DsbA/DsbL [Burkholderiaceae bacterium]
MSFAFVSSLAATAAFAQASAPVEGTDYRVVKPVQSTEAPAGKVEVIEFFGYWCPHCHEFEPTMSDWSKRNEAKVSTSYVPIAFQSSMTNMQKLYYALDALGKEKELRRKIFNAIHDEHSLAPTADAGAIADWVAKNGIDKKKFIDVFNSFSVQSKVNRANQIAKAYGVDAVPELGIGGKYLVNVQARTIGNADAMVARALKEK